jgi:lysophospholipase
MFRNKYITSFGADEDIVEKVKEKLSLLKVKGYFKGTRGIKIYYEKFIKRSSKGKIVISHGLAECIEKYTEIIYYFLNEGYSVYIWEHRGHGRSGSLGKKDFTQINVEKFDYYVEDLKKFIDEIVLKEDNLYLFSHSMGGTIGAKFIEEYPGYFKKAILSSPMLEIVAGDMPNFLVKFGARITAKFGKGDEFIVPNQVFDGYYDFYLAKTSDENRYRNYFNDILKNKRVQRGGASYNWLKESVNVIDEVLKKENLEKIDIPILILQAGKDALVGDRGHKIFKEGCENCNIIRFEKGKHELYLEKDDLLFSYMDNIFKFLSSDNNSNSM